MQDPPRQSLELRACSWLVWLDFYLFIFLFNGREMGMADGSPYSLARQEMT